MMTPTCRSCNSPLQSFSAFPEMARVTSDCRPWKPGGALARCTGCGLLQKPPTDEFRETIGLVYSDYFIHRQGDGAEQRIFDQTTGKSAPHSALLLDKVRSVVALPQTGRMLDIGCGQGHLLSNFFQRLPDWELCGLEQDGQARGAAMPDKTRLLIGGLDVAEGQFDLITMNHVFEHVEDPAGFLQEVRGKLAPEGILVINVPDWTRNPFDLLVADHGVHYSANTIGQVLSDAGLKLLTDPSSLMAKEATAIAVMDDSDIVAIPESRSAVTDSLQFLKSLADCVHGHGAEIVIFGTAVAAVWLSAVLENRFSCFVDEDPTRAGRQHHGKTVMLPEELPAGTSVVLPFAQMTAEAIARRLAALELDFIIPGENC